ncbi:MAG: helix-turn-helix domain-containing protein [Clostridia bacterium]|nr:helix-turn-helix domain-containing protein [Clostridia bacterium]
MRKSQCDTIIDHIDKYGSISSLEAFREYNITRLAARIHDIEAKGTKIDRSTEVYENESGETVRYTRYRRAS